MVKLALGFIIVYETHELVKEEHLQVLIWCGTEEKISTNYYRFFV